MTSNRHLSKLILIVLLSGAALPAYPQSAVFASRKDSLQYDFNWLRNNLQHNYPSLYRYNSKAAITALFDSCYASIQDTTSDLAFYSMLKCLVSRLHDGHLSCSPSPVLRQYLGKQPAFFPFRLRWINNKVYCYSSNDNRLAPGTEILAINNLPVATLKNRLFPYIVGDGSIETKKQHILGNYFYFYYFLAFGGQSSFNITCQTARDATSTLRVEAVTEKELPPVEDESNENKLLDLSILPGELAVLTIHTFDRDALTAAGLEFEQFLRTAFTTLHNRSIKKLLIDLRGNGGGRDLYGSLLYSYLSPGQFHYYKSLVAATNQLPFNQYKRNETSYNNLTTDMLVKTAAGDYQLQPAAHNNLQLMAPAANNYRGKVWFLTDGLSFSTTAEFCAIARHYHRGLFIGEETGGAFDGNTSGVAMSIVLPASQCTVSYGTIRYNMAVRPQKQSGRGIVPDYPVWPTIQDLLTKRDGQLEQALEIMRK